MRFLPIWLVAGCFGHAPGSPPGEPPADRAWVEDASGHWGFRAGDEIVASLELTRAIELGGTAFASSLGTQVVTAWSGDGTFLWGDQLKIDPGVEAWLVMAPAAPDLVGVGATEGPIELGSASLDPDGDVGLFLARLGLDGEVGELVQIGRVDSYDGSGSKPWAAVQAVVPDPSGEITLFAAFTGQVTLGDEVVTSDQGRELIARLAADGTVRWTRTIRVTGSRDTATITAAAARTDGAVAAVGYWYGEVVVGEGSPTEFRLDSSRPFDSGLVAAWTADGDLEWARAIASPRGSEARSAAALPDGSLAVSGAVYTDSLAIGDGEPDELDLVTTDEEHGFLAIFGSDGAVLGGTYAGGPAVVARADSGDLVLGVAPWYAGAIPATADQPEIRPRMSALQIFAPDLSPIRTAWVSNSSPDEQHLWPAIEAVIPHDGRTLVSGWQYGTQDHPLGLVDVP